MDGKFRSLLKVKFHFWKQELLLSTKNLFYLFPPAVYLPSWLLRIVSEMIFFTFLGYAAMGEEGAYYALIGNATMSVARSILSRGSGLIANEKWMGTLPYIVAADFKYSRFMIGRNIINVLEGLVASFSILTVLSWTSSLLNHKSHLVLWYIPCLFLIALSTMGLSTIIAAITFYARTSMYVSSALWMFLTISCGVVYPISRLPHPLQIATQFLPLTHGLAALRVAASGIVNHVFFMHLAAESVLALIYIGLGTYIMKFTLRVSLSKGTLESF